MRVKFFQLSMIGLLLLTGCGITPEEAGEKFKTEKITLTGIDFSKKALNDFFPETGFDGVTKDQFLSALNIKKDSSRTIEKVSVIVDMSAGMNVGIEQSYNALKAVMNRFVPGTANYYHVDDDPSAIQPISQIKSLADAAYLTNKVNFVHANSMLRPALESAAGSNDQITLVITDFLLDEGAKGDRRLKSGKYIKETADNSTWAKDYFSKWFSGQNRVTIYPFKYNATNYYGKQETKFIYYILFIPKGAENANLASLQKDFAPLFPSVIDLNPSAISLNIKADEIPGACISSSDFSLIKGKGNKPQVFEDYYAEHIPFSFPALQKSESIANDVVCNMTLANASPFNVDLAVNSFDISKAYYKAIASAKTDWKGNELYDAGKPLSDLTAGFPEKIDTSAPITFKFGENVKKENFMSAYKGLAKLLYARIEVKSLTLKDLDPSLSWDFQTKEGAMENAALRESIHLALDEFAASNKNFQVGSLLVSFHDK